MLHQELMFRFEETAVNRPCHTASAEAEDTNHGEPEVSKTQLVLSICGNVFVGTALIGSLFMAPLWLARLLGWY